MTDKEGKYNLEINIKTTGVDEHNPSSFSLYQNYPNPFNPSTVISYEMKNRNTISLDIFSITGQYVRTLFKGTLDAGIHTVAWDGYDDSGKSAGAGVYFYRICSGFSFQTKKMLLRDGVYLIAKPIYNNSFSNTSEFGNLTYGEGNTFYLSIRN